MFILFLQERLSGKRIGFGADESCKRCNVLEFVTTDSPRCEHTRAVDQIFKAETGKRAVRSESLPSYGRTDVLRFRKQ